MVFHRECSVNKGSLNGAILTARKKSARVTAALLLTLSFISVVGIKISGTESCPFSTHRIEVCCVIAILVTLGGL